MDPVIILPANHHRALSARLFMVEQLLDDMARLMSDPPDASCYRVVKDMNDDLIAHDLSAISDAKQHIAALAAKYNSKRDIQSLQRYLRAKHTKIWEVLSDTSVHGLRGFGAFPQEFAAEFDSDIEKLIELTEKIKM